MYRSEAEVLPIENEIKSLKKKGHFIPHSSVTMEDS